MYSICLVEKGSNAAVIWEKLQIGTPLFVSISRPFLVYIEAGVPGKYLFHDITDNS
uniref:Uncharacterized protein n=1 Tax=Anguilla anguilla TaxID=7936 RepID=A0A0E9XDR7_ANGAN